MMVQMCYGQCAFDGRGETWTYSRGFGSSLRNREKEVFRVCYCIIQPLLEDLDSRRFGFRRPSWS